MLKMFHFQYNGLLSGLLLLSISSLASHSVLLAGLLFSGLLMFKVRMVTELIRQINARKTIAIQKQITCCKKRKSRKQETRRAKAGRRFKPFDQS